MTAPIRLIPAVTPDARADAISLSGYSPLYGYPIGYIHSPATGSLVARYANGMTLEVGLPTCAGCDAPLPSDDFCADCDAGPTDWITRRLAGTATVASARERLSNFHMETM